MKESILTIPVNEVFEPRQGCPICRMRDTVETRITEYIMGAAMMEPDIRIETNRQGFCFTHFEMMLLLDNRLSLGLMINSYLEVNREIFFSENKKAENKGIFQKKEITTTKESCFVCEKIDWGINHMLKTLFVLFKGEEEFRKIFLEQEFFCLPHYKLLLEKSRAAFSKKEHPKFIEALNSVESRYMEKINKDIDDFCRSFDYRNAGMLHKPEMEHVKFAVPYAIKFLTGRRPSELE